MLTSDRKGDVVISFIFGNTVHLKNADAVHLRTLCYRRISFGRNVVVGIAGKLVVLLGLEKICLYHFQRN